MQSSRLREMAPAVTPAPGGSAAPFHDRYMRRLNFLAICTFWGWIAKISETNSAECPGWNQRLVRIFLETPLGWN